MTRKWSEIRQQAADRDPDFEDGVAAERDALLAEQAAAAEQAEGS